MLTKIKAFLATKLGQTVERVGILFVITFGVTLGVNGDHLLHAHGLSALTSALPSLAVSALYAAYRVVRPQVNAVAATELAAAGPAVEAAVKAAETAGKP